METTSFSRLVSRGKKLVSAGQLRGRASGVSSWRGAARPPRPPRRSRPAPPSGSALTGRPRRLLGRSTPTPRAWCGQLPAVARYMSGSGSRTTSWTTLTWSRSITPTRLSAEQQVIFHTCRVRNGVDVKPALERPARWSPRSDVGSRRGFPCSGRGRLPRCGRAPQWLDDLANTNDMARPLPEPAHRPGCGGHHPRPGTVQAPSTPPTKSPGDSQVDSQAPTGASRSRRAGRGDLERAARSGRARQAFAPGPAGRSPQTCGAHRTGL